CLTRAPSIPSGAMNCPQLPRVLLAMAALCASAPALAKPEITQKLDGFLRPVAAVFSPDGGSLYVVNHAQGSAGTLPRESFVSKLSVDPSGSVAVAKMRFLDDLTAPIDIDFAPAQIGAIPEGAMTLLAGSSLIQDEMGRTQKDLSKA